MNSSSLACRCREALDSPPRRATRVRHGAARTFDTGRWAGQVAPHAARHVWKIGLNRANDAEFVSACPGRDPPIGW